MNYDTDKSSHDASFLHDEAGNAPEFSVSELSSTLRRTIEEAFGRVRVRGEISGFRGRHGSGHAYFALKDDKSKLDAVIWRGVYDKLRIKPEEGIEVIAEGKLTTYPGRSNYQIVIDRLTLAGAGALMALLEARRKKLEGEGLFDPARKQLLPFLPKRIGLITSETGAVIRDMLHRLADRFPLHALLWPVRVQGDGAAEEIAQAIDGFNHAPISVRPDLIIVARGGGSIEDLWCFNEEIVVRAAANSNLALISAIGHETDWTLLDYAADIRAPTPTAAIELAVPVKRNLIENLELIRHRLITRINRDLDGRKQTLSLLHRQLNRPQDRLGAIGQRFDFTSSQFHQAIDKRITHANTSLNTIRFDKRLLSNLLISHHARHGELSRRLPRALDGGFIRKQEVLMRIKWDRLKGILLKKNREHLLNINKLLSRFASAHSRVLNDQAKRLDALSHMLDALSYHKVLERGFSVIRDPKTKQPLTEIGALDALNEINIVMKDGARTAHLKQTIPSSSSKKAHKPSSKQSKQDNLSDQPNLL